MKYIQIVLIALLLSACGSTEPNDGEIFGVAIMEGVWPIEVDALYISIDEEIVPAQVSGPFPVLGRIDSLYWPASDSLISAHSQNGDITTIAFSFRLAPGIYQFHWGAHSPDPDYFTPRMTSFRTLKANQELNLRMWLEFYDY